MEIYHRSYVYQTVFLMGLSFQTFRSSFWCAADLAWRVAISKNISKVRCQGKGQCSNQNCLELTLRGLDVCFRLPEFQAWRRFSLRADCLPWFASFAGSNDPMIQ